MPLKLTWRINGEKDIDLMVSDEQKIIETMQILSEREFLPKDEWEAVKYIKSIRMKKQVNVLLTYKEANIFSGDILELRVGEEL